LCGFRVRIGAWHRLGLDLGLFRSPFEVWLRSACVGL
jgi:hypothetical protein